MQIYQINPIGKPRQTHRDKWKKRLPVLRYHAFCDEVRLNKIILPESGWHVTFVLAMPLSWSQRRRAEMNGTPHRQKPDKDNLEKALLDAIFDDDSHIWDGRVSKIWGEKGQIRIERADKHGSQ